MNDEGIDLVVWQAITGAVEDIFNFIDGAFAGEGANVDLDALYRKTAFRLDTLREALGADLSETQKRQILAPITFLIDERVLVRLSARSMGGEYSWPLLQRAVVELEYGGDLFFLEADRLAHGPDPSALLVQIFIYCLRQGFRGRYADRPEVIAELEASLWNRLSRPLPPGALVPVPADRVAAALPGRVWFIAAAVGFVATWQLFLLAVMS